MRWSPSIRSALVTALTALGLLLWRLGRLDRARWYHLLLIAAGPLPLLANQLGWITAEVGRQPWTVYGYLRTAQSVSITVTTGELVFSLVLLGSIYTLLLSLYLFVLVRELNHGPAPLPGTHDAEGT